MKSKTRNRKQRKNWTRLLLVVAMVVSILPLNATTSKAETRPTNPRIKNGVTTWDCIYFGNYYQSNSTTKEKIKWRVLSVDGDKAFVVADKGLDCQPYNKEYTEVTWETCTLRNWLNSTFLNSAFTSTEQTAIYTTTVVNEDNINYNTSDKIFLLSQNEVQNQKYGFNSEFGEESETRQCKATAYAVENKCFTISSDSYDGNCWWWLRSTSDFSDVALGVNYDGWGFTGLVHYDDIAVRPALNINLSSSSWSYAGTVSASLGKGSSGGDEPTDNPNAVVTRPGEKVFDKNTNANYVVISSGEKNEVAYAVNKDSKTKSVKVPDTISIGSQIYKVTAVADRAFKNNKNITKITINDNITQIGEDAFRGCSKLNKVYIGKNVEKTGKNAFKGCKKLRTITIKSQKLTSKSVAKNAFSGIKKPTVFKVPKSKVKAYKKLFRKKGLSSKVKIKA